MSFIIIFGTLSFPVVTGGSCLQQDISYSSLLVPTNRNFAKYITAADGSVLSTSESSQSSQGSFATTGCICVRSVTDHY